MSWRQKFKRNRWGIAVLAAATLCLVVNLAAYFGARQLGSSLSANKAGFQGSRFSGTELSSALLFDSIVSLVQTYYVDSKRVDNASLFRQTLKNLSRHPEIEFSEQNETAGLMFRGTELSYSLSSKMPYRTMIKHFEEISSRLDSTRTQASEKEGQGESGKVLVLNAMLNALDAHSVLMSPESYRELRQGTEGTFGGLGVLVGIREQQLTVIKPLAKSPAVRVGMMEHDRILTIDGIQTFGYSLDQLVEYMRGDPGTRVEISYIRAGDLAPRLATMERQVINVESVESEDLSTADHKIIRVKIDSFSSRTAAEVLSALSTFRTKKKGAIDGVVLDLRSNPGGLLEQAVQVADLFLKSGVIVTTRGRRQEVESADNDYFEMDYPITVLMNSESASASEIVAGALQDHGRAVIIGQPSFGKGSVQTIFELPGEQALKLTIARYYTPSGRSIQNVGIIPDIWLQPVHSLEKNQNLLGKYRYKSERFLRNHLEAVVESTATVEAPKAMTFKGYYLRDRGDMNAVEQKGGPDPEQDLAMAIIKRVADTYGSPLPMQAQRAGHWLALSAVDINQHLRRYGDDVEDWLTRTHQTSWTGNNHVFEVAKNVRLEIPASRPKGEQVGNNYQMPWKLTNLSEDPVHKLSLFFSSDVSGFETVEHLIGQLPAGATIDGKTAILLAPFLEPGPLTVFGGVAIDAQATGPFVQDLKIDVTPKAAMDLKTEISLVEETGGSVNGVVEPNESAKLKVVVENVSDQVAKNVKAFFVNLAGAQVEVSGDSVHLGKIKQGGKKTAFVRIRGSEKILTNQLYVGLSVESPDLLYPIHRSWSVPGAGSQGVASVKRPKITSH